ncbi:MAG: hypothetical protein ACE5J4_02380 [Candidatus Aenigmatarchaeota archaeon]
MKKNIISFLVVIIALTVSITGVFALSYFGIIKLSIWDEVTPKIIQEKTLFSVGPGGGACNYMITYKCPEQILGLDQVDYCKLEKTGCGININWMDGPGNYHPTLEKCKESNKKMGHPEWSCTCDANGFPTILKPNESDDYGYEGPCNVGSSVTVKVMTLHYTGNGICEHESPYNENCKNAPEDCGPCPTPDCPEGYVLKDGMCVPEFNWAGVGIGFIILFISFLIGYYLYYRKYIKW